jgi:hypothetical protein
MTSKRADVPTRANDGCRALYAVSSKEQHRRQKESAAIFFLSEPPVDMLTYSLTGMVVLCIYLLLEHNVFEVVQLIEHDTGTDHNRGERVLHNLRDNANLLSDSFIEIP